MGTTADVSVAGSPDPRAALDAAFGALDLVDRQMSLWRPESELSRLNATGSLTASPQLLAVLRHALDVAADSQGAFDPTVEPLVRAHGHLGDVPSPSTPEDLERLRRTVGFRKVRIEQARVTLEPGTRLDLGGIAKGYAADLALTALCGSGCRSGLVDLGSSSLAIRSQRETIAVANPEDESAPPWAVFEIADGGVSTSGGGQRSGHILDPRTGASARSVLGATVVANTAMEADTLSTAVFVLGAEEGLALLSRRRAQGLVLFRRRGRAVIRATPGFAGAYRLRAAPFVAVEGP